MRLLLARNIYFSSWRCFATGVFVLIFVFAVQFLWFSFHFLQNNNKYPSSLFQVITQPLEGTTTFYRKRFLQLQKQISLNQSSSQEFPSSLEFPTEIISSNNKVQVLLPSLDIQLPQSHDIQNPKTTNAHTHKNEGETPAKNTTDSNSEHHDFSEFLVPVYKNMTIRNETKLIKQIRVSRMLTVRILVDSNETIVGDSVIGGVYDGKVMRLFKQIRKLPKQPTFSLYFRSSETDHSWQRFLLPLGKILASEKWKYIPPQRTEEALKSNLIFTRDQIPRTLNQGHQMINTMGVCNCIGGTKAQQLSCRKVFTKKFGCDYESLGIQPVQFDLTQKSDCEFFFHKFLRRAENANKFYILKPVNSFHGAGVTLYQPSEYDKLEERFKTCENSNNQGYLIMEYITNPATMNGAKIDLRTYMLVASMQPKLVFLYREGIFRRSMEKFDLFSKNENVHILNSRGQVLSNHFFNYSTISKVLETENGLGPNFIDRVLWPRLKKVHKFLFESEMMVFEEKLSLSHRGRFHLFAMDWVIDNNGNIFLLEGNKFPAIVNYPGNTGLTPKIWVELIHLLKMIQASPREIPKTPQVLVKEKFAYKGWELIYNELEEVYNRYALNITYNPCIEF